ncbi:MAG: hypothetical protein IJ199_00900 [Prevotella sp.]|nr:hypothetical protein [Prevotella sp.]
MSENENNGNANKGWIPLANHPFKVVIKQQDVEVTLYPPLAEGPHTVVVIKEPVKRKQITSIVKKLQKVNNNRNLNLKGKIKQNVEIKDLERNIIDIISKNKK